MYKIVTHFIFFVLIGLFSIYPKYSFALDNGESCHGTAVVQLKSGLFGSIYISDMPNSKGRFSRNGYLPSGTLVHLEEPFQEAKKRFRKKWCGFRIGNNIKGHISRSHLTSLEHVILDFRSSNLKISALVAPANPDPERNLVLYNSKNLSDHNVLARLNRSSKGLVLLKVEQPDESVLEAWFLPNSNANLNERKTVFLDVTNDRCCDSEGTYRIFYLSDRKSEQNKNSSSLSISEFISSISVSATEIVQDVLKQSKNDFLKLGRCDQEAEFAVNLSVKAGIDFSNIGIGGVGEGKLTWKKAKNTVFQFITIGTENSLELNLAGIAKCRSGRPAFLSGANIEIVNSKGKANFVVDRQEFFNVINEKRILNKLEKSSSLANSRRSLSPLIVVPARSSKSTFYWSLFDQIERYMSQKVFAAIDDFPISTEQQFEFTLILVEMLSHWQHRS